MNFKLICIGLFFLGLQSASLAEYALSSQGRTIYWEETSNRFSIKTGSAYLCSIAIKGSFHGSWGFPFRAISGKPFTVSRDEKSFSAAREYQLPDGQFATFKITLSQESESRFRLAWNPGISAAKIEKIPHFSLSPVIYITSEYRKIPFMFAGKRIEFNSNAKCSGPYSRILALCKIDKMVFFPDNPQLKVILSPPECTGSLRENRNAKGFCSVFVQCDWMSSDKNEIIIEW